MEPNKILAANILDIIFEGKNKAYGAYELRNNYVERISTSLGVTVIGIIIFIISVSLKTGEDVNIAKKLDIDLTLSNKEIEKEIIPALPKLPKAKPVKTVAYVPPIILKDKLVIEPPVEIDKLADSRIDIKNIEGNIDDGTIAPPQEIKNSKVIESLKTSAIVENLPFNKVEIDAKFKGDWGKYVKKEIEKNMDELTEAGVSGTCIVKFIVSKNERVSDVEAVTMKGSKLSEVAVNAIRKGPNWIPAQQNGREVNAYRLQPVTFKIDD